MSAKEETKKKRSKAKAKKPSAARTDQIDSEPSKGRSGRPAQKATASASESIWGDLTAEQIVQARDRDGLSWRDVANVLGLGSPGRARKAYSDLTGKPHNSSVMQGRRAKRASSRRRQVHVNPKWDDDTDRQTIVDSITGSTIYVLRKHGDEPEEIRVARVLRFDDADPSRPAVEFIEGFYTYDKKRDIRVIDDRCTGAIRTIFLDAIVEVR